MKVAIFGTGGHARVIAEGILARGDHEIAGLVSADGAAVDFLPGIDVIATNDDFVEPLSARGVEAVIIGLGDAGVRLDLAGRIVPHFRFISVIHPSAVVSPTVSIAPGAVVMAGAVIQSKTVIGAHAIVNTRASIDHDCMLEEGVHVSPGAIVAGHVRIGRGSWIGAGAVVVDHISIGEDVRISAGSIVHKNLADGSRLVGSRILGKEDAPSQGK